MRLIMIMALALVSGCSTHTPSTSMTRETAMTHAKGTFEVKLAPQTDEGMPSTLGRMSLDKQFAGDLMGTGQGQMLTAGGAEGSGVYVAVEQVEGTLHGRSGSFLLHHTGVMTRGTPSLKISVVPDSGTGELAGITGTLDIIIAADGGHSYELAYSLP